MRFIGDVHGKVAAYLKLIENQPQTLQVGDFGMGFFTPFQHEQLARGMAKGEHTFIRGNHDHPTLALDNPHCLADGHYNAALDLMAIGGAWSIDKDWRTPGLDWWPDEELSLEQMDVIAADYAEKKPSILVTHDCPEQISYSLFCMASHKKHWRTNTGMFLQELFETHQPDLWIFGHWHESRSMTWGGTDFMCLAELETFDLTINEMVESA